MKYSCSICRKESSSQYNLTIHMRKHTGQRPFKCGQCSKSFVTEYTLNLHIKIHSGERLYKCTDCDKSFVTNKHLNAHKKVHSTQRTYVCMMCEKSFHGKTKLIAHENVHNGIRPFSCTMCPKTFSCKGNMDRHVRVHTGEKCLFCDECNKYFTTKQRLINHLRVHTGERPYCCNICSKEYKSIYSLKAHNRKHCRQQLYKAKVEDIIGEEPTQTSSTIDNAIHTGGPNNCLIVNVAEKLDTYGVRNQGKPQAATYMFKGSVRKFSGLTVCADEIHCKPTWIDQPVEYPVQQSDGITVSANEIDCRPSWRGQPDDQLAQQLDRVTVSENYIDCRQTWVGQPVDQLVQQSDDVIATVNEIDYKPTWIAQSVAQPLQQSDSKEISQNIADIILKEETVVNPGGILHSLLSQKSCFIDHKTEDENTIFKSESQEEEGILPHIQLTVSESKYLVVVKEELEVEEHTIILPSDYKQSDCGLDTKMNPDKKISIEKRSIDKLPIDLLNSRWKRFVKTNSTARPFAGILNNTFTLPERYHLGKFNVECKHCKALHFESELKQANKSFNNCCNFGTVDVPIPRVTNFIKYLLEGEDQDSVNFRNNIHFYNNCFAMAALTSNIKSAHKTEPYYYHSHGHIYHNSQNDPYSKKYFIDSAKIYETMGSCTETLMSKLNDDVQKHSERRFWERWESMDIHVNGKQETSNDFCKMTLDTDNYEYRRYSAPDTDEIGAVYCFCKGAEGGPQGVNSAPKKHVNKGNPDHVFAYSSICDPMSYPLLRPYGDLGWHPTMTKCQKNNQKPSFLSQLEYYRFLLAIRNSFNILHHSRKLFQQYLVDIWIRLEWKIRRKRIEIEQYRQFVDYINEDDDHARSNERRVMVRYSVHGTAREMLAFYNDVISTVAQGAKPDIFITFACNTNWDEITSNLYENQVPSDRPDLIARVFHEKFTSLLDDITNNGIIGEVASYFYVINYERHVPIAYMFFCLEKIHKPKSPKAVDRIVRAIIPLKVIPEEKELFDVITAFNLHNRCFPSNTKYPCIDPEKGKCSSNYPKPFRQKTNMNIKGYIEYKRPEDGPFYKTSTEIIDSRWVVPYNPYMSVKYNAHIRVEVCTMVSAINYINSHVHNRTHGARLIIQSEKQCEKNETSYVYTKYVCPVEAMSRILEYDINGHSHEIARLDVHLENNNPKDTTLTAWFNLNSVDNAAKKLFYFEIPSRYRWSRNKWLPKTKNRLATGRLLFVSPKEKERYYLRLLLLNTKGATSYTDLCIVDGIYYHTFEEAAIAAGLVKNTEEYRICLQSAITSATPAEIRSLFAFIIVFCNVSNAQILWNEFVEYMIEDFMILLETKSSEEAFRIAYDCINDATSEFGIELAVLITLTFDILSDVKTLQIKQEGQKLYERLNSKHKEAADAVLCMETQYMLIDGPADEEMMILHHTVYNVLTGRGKKVLTVGSTDSAAARLPNGCKADELFELPSDIDFNKSFVVKVNSLTPLKDIDTIIWEEAEMSSIQIFECVDILLKGIMQSDKPFGGKQVIVSGDFQRNETSCKQSFRINQYPWRRFNEFCIISQTKIKDNNDKCFKVPEILKSGSLENLTDEIFGDIKTMDNMNKLLDRVIIIPEGFNTSEIDQNILNLLPGNDTIYKSIDERDCDNTQYPSEFLNSLTPNDYPPYELHLKKGAIVTLLRNFSVNKGLTKGTRLIVQNLSKYWLGCIGITGTCKGVYILLPRVDFDFETPVKLLRRQFPVRLSFSLTFDEFRGQNFSHVGVLYQLGQSTVLLDQLLVAVQTGKLDKLRIYNIDDHDVSSLSNRKLQYTKSGSTHIKF